MFLKNLNPVRHILGFAEELGRRQRERDQARTESQHRQKELKRLQEENQRLREGLEAAQRAAKRQAAPFSRGKPKSNPNVPGVSLGRRMARTITGRSPIT